MQSDDDQSATARAERRKKEKEKENQAKMERAPSEGSSGEEEVKEVGVV